MSSDSASESDPTAKLEELDERVASDGAVSERLSAVRSRIEEYQETEDESELAELRDDIESELAELRDDIEAELDKGKAKAHDLVDEIEERFSRLRSK